MSQNPQVYANPAAMQPLLPESSGAVLSDLTCEILRKAGALSASLPSSIVRTRVAGLVREMNSYYSNLIEGHKTLPRDIERALRKNFSTDPQKRANQHLSRAHVEVEKLMVERLEKEPALSIHSAAFLQWLHQQFYNRLPDELHFSTTHRGTNYRITPGALRTFEVDVGQHQPPHHGALPAMLARFEAFYADQNVPATHRLVAIAAAHHRLAWIHPFADGNGRVTRLYSHASLIRCQVNGLGLWTLSRGLARRRAAYYAQLSSADQMRRNDLDGRGNLSDRALGEFCVFMLQTMLDQLDFMGDLLQLQNLAARIERHLQFGVLHRKPRDRERLSRLVKAALFEGEIERGKVGRIVGLSDRAARNLTNMALKEGLLDSPSEKGPWRSPFLPRLSKATSHNSFWTFPPAKRPTDVPNSGRGPT